MFGLMRRERDHMRRPFVEQVLIYGDKGRERAILKDVSQSGARICSSGAGFLPKHFKLWWPSGGYFIDCKVRWQRGNEAGVKFGYELPNLGPLENPHHSTRTLPPALGNFSIS